MTFMIIFLYFCLAVFGLTVIAAAWLHFKGESDRLKNAPDGDDRPGDSPRYGLRDKLMARILERRLDE